MLIPTSNSKKFDKNWLGVDDVVGKWKIKEGGSVPWLVII